MSLFKNYTLFCLGINIFLIILTINGCSIKKANQYCVPTPLYPIGKYGKWGYTDENGNIKIPLKFDEADLFYNGLAKVKERGKYGFIDSSGEYKILPNLTWATNFKACHARIAEGHDTFSVHCSNTGKLSHKNIYCPDIYSGCGYGRYTADIIDFTTKVDNKFELIFWYFLTNKNATKSFKIIDTTNLQLDSILPYNRYTYILQKDNKFGLYVVPQKNTQIKRSIIVLDSLHDDKSKIDKSFYYNTIRFPYDTFCYIKDFFDISKSELLVSRQKLWVFVNEYGDELNSPYISVKRNINTDFFLVEYAPYCFGILNIQNRKEYFKRKNK